MLVVPGDRLLEDSGSTPIFSASSRRCRPASPVRRRDLRRDRHDVGAVFTDGPKTPTRSFVRETRRRWSNAPNPWGSRCTCSRRHEPPARPLTMIEPGPRPVIICASARRRDRDRRVVHRALAPERHHVPILAPASMAITWPSPVFSTATSASRRTRCTPAPSPGSTRIRRMPARLPCERRCDVGCHRRRRRRPTTARPASRTSSRAGVDVRTSTPRSMSALKSAAMARRPWPGSPPAHDGRSPLGHGAGAILGEHHGLRPEPGAAFTLAASSPSSAPAGYGSGDTVHGNGFAPGIRSMTE